LKEVEKKHSIEIKVLIYHHCWCHHHHYTRKNLTSCNKSSTRCIRTACHKLSTGLEQLVDNL
jgi:hypothetical protein